MCPGSVKSSHRTTSFCFWLLHFGRIFPRGSASFGCGRPGAVANSGRRRRDSGWPAISRLFILRKRYHTNTLNPPNSFKHHFRNHHILCCFLCKTVFCPSRTKNFLKFPWPKKHRKQNNMVQCLVDVRGQYIYMYICTHVYHKRFCTLAH